MRIVKLERRRVETKKEKKREGANNVKRVGAGPAGSAPLRRPGHPDSCAPRDPAAPSGRLKWVE